MSVPEPHLNFHTWCLSSAQEKTSFAFFSLPKAYTPYKFQCLLYLKGSLILPDGSDWHTPPPMLQQQFVKLSKYLACSVCVIDMFMKVKPESDSYLVLSICDPTDPCRQPGSSVHGIL